MMRTIAILIVLLTAGNHVLAAMSTFDANDEGWRIGGDAQSLPTYQSTGGNPGGYISGTDTTHGAVWFFKAPAAFCGDYTAAYGTNLTFDLRQSGLGSQLESGGNLFLSGGGLQLAYDAPNNPGVDWTTYSVPLIETSGWRIRVDGASPTQAQMLQVLGNITSLEIRGEFFVGSDTASLDNVRMVPEPTTLGLLCIGGLTLLRRRTT